MRDSEPTTCQRSKKNVLVAKSGRRRHAMLASVFLVLTLSFALPLISYSVHWIGMSVQAQDTGGVVKPDPNFWQAIREGEAGYSAVQGNGAGVLIQADGNLWRLQRDSSNIQKLPWAIVGMALLIFLYHLIFGSNKIDARPLSGRTIKRWNGLDRLVHWITAITFILLAITGMSMLVGKKLLIPLLGKAGFAAWAGLSINIHNLLGPVFSVGIALMIIMWIWQNFPTFTDLKWLAAAGGMFSKGRHPSAGRMNGGEKIWFWIISTVGVLVCVTGIVLVSPVFGFPGVVAFVLEMQLPRMDTFRTVMQQTTFIHMVSSIGWTTIALGHIYLGTIGVEGTFKGMASGHVAEEWAKQHHDLWYEKLQQKGKLIDPAVNQSKTANNVRSQRDSAAVRS